jgi:hypothetical protein
MYQFANLTPLPHIEGALDVLRIVSDPEKHRKALEELMAAHAQANERIAACGDIEAQKAALEMEKKRFADHCNGVKQQALGFRRKIDDERNVHDANVKKHELAVAALAEERQAHFEQVQAFRVRLEEFDRFKAMLQG